MDLLGVLKKEITTKNITDKRQIAQYIYVRVGQIFEYDPLWLFGTDYDREIIKNKVIDIRNVTDFNIVCFSWARIYTDLLKEFNIESEVVDLNSHVNVAVFIDGRRYLADLYASFIDLIRIKFCMSTCFNCQLSKDPINAEITTEKVDSNIYAAKNDANIKCIEEKLNIFKQKLGENNIKYIDIVFNTIIMLINANKNSIEFVSGVAFINDRLKTFINNNYKPKVLHFLDNNGSYMEIYYINHNKYLIYRKDNSGLYCSSVISKDDLEEIKKTSTIININPYALSSCRLENNNIIKSVFK